MQKATANLAIILVLLTVITWATPALAANNCFIAVENGKILKEEGDCRSRYAPESTFKIVLSLIGFDSGILQDETHPSWSCGQGCDHHINVCIGNHDPRTWMRDSCLWYSRELTTKLGMEKFHKYIRQFQYGNMDLTGDKGQNNGLTNSWLSNSLDSHSLRISPLEQTAFLKKLVERQLQISQESYDKTKNIMFIQEMWGGWKLYGKSGSGKQNGWFVGYIEKDQRHIVFASHITGTNKRSAPTSFRARHEAFTHLWYIIDRAAL
ncbi:MAG: class D beta-lactamase [Proteobacteria bacterium]|nr:class D beta-lactamase [Pseudomonadota bacterium]